MHAHIMCTIPKKILKTLIIQNYSRLMCAKTYVLILLNINLYVEISGYICYCGFVLFLCFLPPLKDGTQNLVSLCITKCF